MNLTLDERKREWERLVACEAWKWYVGMLQEKIDSNNAEILSPMQPGQEYTREWQKGFTSGMYTAGTLPETQIELINVDMEKETRDVEKNSNV